MEVIDGEATEKQQRWDEFEKGLTREYILGLREKFGIPDAIEMAICASEDHGRKTQNKFFVLLKSGCHIKFDAAWIGWDSFIDEIFESGDCRVEWISALKRHVNEWLQLEGAYGCLEVNGKLWAETEGVQVRVSDIEVAGAYDL